jgi:hypothetical protein
MPNEPENPMAKLDALWDFFLLGGFVIIYVGGGLALAFGLIWLNRKMPWKRKVL